MLDSNIKLFKIFTHPIDLILELFWHRWPDKDHTTTFLNSMLSYIILKGPLKVVFSYLKLPGSLKLLKG